MKTIHILFFHFLIKFSISKSCNRWSAISTLSLLAFTSHGYPSTSKKKICVIGTGSSGLNSLKQLVDHLDEFEPVAFEKISSPGGLWVYNGDGHKDSHGLPVHSSVYATLTTSTPKELMAFPDYPDFYGSPHSIVPHYDVMHYLRNFTLHFNLHNYIKFDTLVEHISPIFDSSNNGEKTKWTVKTKNLNTYENSETICDGVMVATGHHSKPRKAPIKGLDIFKGMVNHTHEYRKAEVYTGKTVVILGAGAAGIDIAIEICEYAKKVYLSHRHTRLNSKFPANLEQTPGVISAGEDYFILSDNSTLYADAILLAIGYEISYPFLDETSALKIKSNYVFPLYKEIINANHQTMAIIGLPNVVCRFLFPYFQAKYYVAYLRDIFKLPLEIDMIKDINKMYARKSAPNGQKPNKVKCHNLNGKEWKYINELATIAGFEHLPRYYEKGYKTWADYRSTHYQTYKSTDFHIDSNSVDGFHLIHSEDQLNA